VIAPLRRGRTPNPGLRAIQTAGPRRGWLFVAAIVSILAMVATVGIWGGIALDDWIKIIAIPIVAFTIVGLIDRDAVIARRAIIEYAGLQARRLPPGYPTDREAADAWLADPENAPENPVRRAYILDLAGRPGDAAVELDRVDPSDASDLAAAERLRATWAAGADKTWDASGFDRLVEGLPDDERRWQRLALAWMRALEGVQRGRPWRDDFVASVRDLGPWHTTARGWFVVVSQQFTFTIVLVLLSVLITVFLRA
jgi:hypothetical protein